MAKFNKIESIEKGSNGKTVINVREEKFEESTFGYFAWFSAGALSVLILISVIKVIYFK